MSKILKLTVRSCAKDLMSGEVSLFPTEKTEAPSFTQEELFRLSKLFSPLYREYVENVSIQLSTYYNMKKNVCDIIAREAMVPLIHFFIDRLLRLDRLLKVHKGVQFVTVDSEFFSDPLSIEAFRSYSNGSFVFNQSLLCRLSEIYDIPIVKEDDVCCERAESNAGYIFYNYNYDQKYLVKLKRAAYLGFSRILSFVNPSLVGKIPVLGMGYATPSLQAKGLYGLSSFVSLSGRENFVSNPPNIPLRNELLEPALNQALPSLRSFFDLVGFNNDEYHQRAENVLRRYMLEIYPTSMLEDAQSNIERCVKQLKKYKGQSIVSASFGSTEVIYFFAAAKSLNMQIIGCQHGGHEGYEDDCNKPLEIEYNYIDKYISWGWTSLLDERLENKVDVVALPSPWLDDRRSRWKKHLSVKRRHKASKEYDFLLMPNKIYTYPPAPSGANISRIDHIQKFAKTLIEFVTKATLQNFTILHKPFNKITVDLLHYTMRQLENIGGNCYSVDNNLSKGLRSEITDRCRVILWDQPGMGFLECLVSGMPTMILWPRVYNREIQAARAIFSDLEDVGICHRSVDYLLKEYNTFMTSPQKWMKESKRVDVIERFCREYAWSEKNWATYWHEFIQSLN